MIKKLYKGLGFKPVDKFIIVEFENKTIPLGALVLENYLKETPPKKGNCFQNGNSSG